MGRKEFLDLLDDLKFQRSQVKLRENDDPIFQYKSKEQMLNEIETQMVKLRKGAHTESQIKAAS